MLPLEQFNFILNVAQRFICRVPGDFRIAALVLKGGNHAQALSLVPRNRWGKAGFEAQVMSVHALGVVAGCKCRL